MQPPQAPTICWPRAERRSARPRTSSSRSASEPSPPRTRWTPERPPTRATNGCSKRWGGRRRRSTTSPSARASPSPPWPRASTACAKPAGSPGRAVGTSAWARVGRPRPNEVVLPMVIDLIAVVLVGTVIAMGWQLDEFGRSLTAVSSATLDAYNRALRSFVTWAERLSLDGPAAVDRQTLRRYLAYLATRGTARRTIARRASALRRYFRWARRTGLVSDDPSAGLSAPKGEERLPRGLRPDGLRHLIPDEPVPGGEGVAKVAVSLRDTALLELLYGS